MTFGEIEIGAFVATLLRAAGLAFTAPIIGDSDVSVRARLAFTVAIAFAVAPARPGVAYSDLAVCGMVELAVGLLTGTTARFVLARVAVAGQLVGLSLGLGFAAEYDTRANESASTLRALVMAIAGIAFLAAGGLEELVRGIAAGPAQITHVVALGPMLVEHATHAFGHGLALASPIVLGALVANVGLALVNRAAPAANVFSIALAAGLLVGGLILLATASGFVAGVIEAAKQAVAALGA
jgi:flagellar biosynthetic protein FliR